MQIPTFRFRSRGRRGSPGRGTHLALASVLALAVAFGAHGNEARADDSPAGDSRAERASVGQQAPDFTLESSQGETYALGQLRGGEKHLVLIFFRGSW